MLKLLVAVCPNGLGHYRRTVAILECLQAKVPRLSITIACDPEHRRRMEGWVVADRFWSRDVRLAPEVMEPGMAWLPDEAGYTTDRLFGWIERFADLHKRNAPDLVMSDNLAMVLEVCPDACLTGSFLWSDVLESKFGHVTAVADFVERERALLDARRPPMICVSGIAMPGVRDRTASVPVGWMCESPGSLSMGPTRDGGVGRSNPSRAGRVGILGSGTAATALLAHAADTLLSATCRPVAASEAVHGLVTQGEAGLLERFDYTPDDFMRTSVVITRPGMGTLTECVTYGLPVVLLHEPGNIEVEHNGRTVESLGFGLCLGSDPTEQELVAAVEELEYRADDVRRSIEKLPRSGVGEAAHWLAVRLGHEAAVETPASGSWH